MSVFGDLTTRTDVEGAVIAHLQAWMPTYIAEVERQQGYDARALPMIGSYTVIAGAWEKWPADQFPALLVFSPGLAEPPRGEGAGPVRAKWACGIAAITEGGGTDPNLSARKTAGAYFAAVRGALLQHQSLGGFAKGVSWTDERYDQIPSDQERSLATAYGMFSVEVAQALDRSGGVADPLDNPYEEPDPWPTAQTMSAEVTPDGTT